VKVPTQHIWTKYHLHIAIAGIKLAVIHGVSLADLGWPKPLAQNLGVNQILQKYPKMAIANNKPNLRRFFSPWIYPT